MSTKERTLPEKFLGLAFNELTINQFSTIEIPLSKLISTTDKFGLDFYKVLSAAKLQMSVLPINIIRSLIKILNMREPRIELKNSY